MVKPAGLFIGVGLAVIMLLVGAPADVPVLAWRTAAVAVVMAIWWGTEALPPFVTALLPLILFPAFEVMSFSEVAAPFAHRMIFLFLGGFLLALAIEKWNLHQRIALHVLLVMGGQAKMLVFGFMLATAVLSMWMTNTATTLMMLPIAVSILHVVFAGDGKTISARNQAHFRILLPLSVAYGATIGGMATLIGTPPNAFLAGYVSDTFGIDIDFAAWMMVGLPVSAILLPFGWWVLTRFVYPVDFTVQRPAKIHFQKMLHSLGAVSKPEWRVGVLFVLVALGWAFRKPVIELSGWNWLSDSAIAITGAVLLFIIPSGLAKHEKLANAALLKKLPFDVLLLFGGGLALASGISASGLAAELGRLLSSLGAINGVVLVLAATSLVIFLTELTSNLATTATFLPIVGAVGMDAGLSPLLLAVPVALAASCAFMLPIATPPNAICYGSGHVSLQQMAKAGFWLNIAGIVLLSVVSVFWVPVVFG
ncbi:Sodium-dependent anion transporter family [hydrothermal vent metagenome]|uniref:Sodium-dependent anion transporter family n=1 Tax=hydrothermal vent metagenome TaxID=652676 RepID=A0A3B0S5P1_9ZZZZ